MEIKYNKQRMWKDIWEKKGRVATNEDITLSDLIAIDGFDSKYGVIDEKVWIGFAQYVSDTIKMENKKEVLEIGCGCGAFLYALKNILDEKNINFTGIDYSKSLIEIVKSRLKNFNLYELEAIDIKLLNKKFDFIFANSVFQYFEDEKYAFDVLDSAVSILEKTGSMAILDLNDKSKEKDFYEIRRGAMGEEEYNKKYDGLNHMFYSKTDMFNYFNNKGFEKIIIEDQNIKDYENSKFRFNVFALNKLQ